MKTQKIKSLFVVIMLGSFLVGCLKTRSEVSPNDQSYISRKKQQENQKANAGLNGGSNLTSSTSVDPEETIRTLNGRIEVLENQVTQLQKQNADAANSTDANKIAALQEALSKMELQIQKMEAEKTAAIPDPKLKSSDENLKHTLPPSDKTAAASNAKKNSYDEAEDLFNKKEWKKAILTYGKFVEEFPKSKLVPDAKYKTGVSFQELGLKDEAMAFYEEVSVQFPQTMAGKKAKIRMTSLNSKASPAKSKKK